MPPGFPCTHDEASPVNIAALRYFAWHFICCRWTSVEEKLTITGMGDFFGQSAPMSGPTVSAGGMSFVPYALQFFAPPHHMGVLPSSFATALDSAMSWPSIDAMVIFMGTDPGIGSNILVTALTVKRVSVPEPSPLVLVGSAIVVLGLSRRRRISRAVAGSEVT